MNMMRNLKQAFLVAVSCGSMAFGQLKNEKIDYAFGDQVADATKLPGLSGKDWGFKETRRALEKFIKENPNALKGKTVLVSVSNPSMMDAIMRANDTGESFIEAVGKNGRVILVGASERRNDGKGLTANKYTRQFVSKHTDVAVYGGPTLPPMATGEKKDPNRDYIYPQGNKEIDAMLARIETALEKSGKKPAVAPKAAR